MKNSTDSSIVFLREIENIESVIEQNKQLAFNYIDLDEYNKIDEDSKLHLNELKSKVKKSLSESNIHILKVNINK